MKRILAAITSGFRYLASPRDLWSSLRFYWQCGDRGHLLFGAGTGLVVIAVGVIIYQSIIGRQVSREISCLARNVYYEARGEPMAGKYAVARVTLNRVVSSHYPDTICEVVYEKRWDRIRRRYVGAFSWTELETPLNQESRAWQVASRIAEEAYYKQDPHDVGSALFYHADHVRPSWARKKSRVAKIGRHIFYN